MDLEELREAKARIVQVPKKCDLGHVLRQVHQRRIACQPDGNRRHQADGCDKRPLSFTVSRAMGGRERVGLVRILRRHGDLSAIAAPFAAAGNAQQSAACPQGVTGAYLTWTVV